MLSDERPNRRPNQHTPPHWVPDTATFFITINCRHREPKQLTVPDVVPLLFNAVEHYCVTGHWQIEILILMPDHLHSLVSFEGDRSPGISKTIASWKRYTSRQFGIRWQRDFFDHRVRSESDLAQKWDYSMM